MSNEEHGYLATDIIAEEDTLEGEEITVSQGESCITVDCPEDLSDDQVTEAEA